MKEPSGKRFVRYIGTATIREITSSQWANVGAKGQKDTYWTRRNGWKIPVEEFNDNALQYFEKDSGFVVDTERASGEDE